MAKIKDILAKRDKKRDLWISRTEQITKLPTGQVTDLLSTKRSQSLRLNTLKLSDNTLHKLKDLGALDHPSDWCKNGYFGVTSGLDEFANDGEVYIQNASSWLPVVALDPKPGEQVLDVCAAPGGKSSHIQAVTDNESSLVCNDNSKSRLMRLQANLSRLNARAELTLYDATRLTKHFESESFDKILLDAPCSGEGLMTLNIEDVKLFDSWSVAHIRRLSDLQKRILSESYKLLKPGGTLVYSTCTMAPEENEAVVDYLLRKNTSSKLEKIDIDIENSIDPVKMWNDREYQSDLSGCLRLLPSKYLEAFFVAKITKE